ncbi:polyprotein [Weevil wasp positive-strand RNA virus 2]|nr:polyprotein [Weevil wasp positive-strand RNA virus 2]
MTTTGTDFKDLQWILATRFYKRMQSDDLTKPCLEHYNKGEVHIDGPPPSRGRCHECRALRRRPADGQMDSTESTEQGMETAEGEKQINTIMTTAVAKAETIHKPFSDGMTLMKMTTGEEIVQFPHLMGRWLQVDHFTLSTSDASGCMKTWDLPFTIYNQLLMPNKLPFQQFVFNRPSMEIKFKVNSHKFAQGRYWATYFYDLAPTGLTGTVLDWKSVFENRAVIKRDHVYMDLGESNEIVVKVPFRAKTAWITSLRDPADGYTGGDYATVGFGCLSALKVPDESAQVMPVTVFARFTESYFTGMRYYKEVDGQMGSAQSTMEGCKDAVNIIRNVPVIGGLLGATTSALGHTALAITRPFCDEAKMKQFEANLKYAGVIKNRDKPAMVFQPRDLRPNYAGNICVGREVEDLNPLRLDPRATTVSLPEHCFEHYNSILELVRIWGYLGSFSWSMSDSAEDNLYSVEPWPTVGDGTWTGTDGASFKTYMGIFSHYYQYYKGSIEFRFDIIGTQFHTGILMISYIPYNTDYTYSQARAGYYKICDVREQRSFEFTVPYINSTLLRNMPYQVMMTGTGVEIPSIGTLKVWVVNPLTPIQSVSTNVDVLVYARAGPDFAFSSLRPTLSCTLQRGAIGYDYGSPTSSIEARRIFADGQMDDGSKEDIDTTPTFGSVAPGGELIQRAEDEMNIFDLLRTWQFLGEMNLDATNKYMLFPVMPYNLYDKYIKDNRSYTNPTSVSNKITTQILNCFRWYRGSIRIMFEWTPDSGTVTSLPMRVLHQPQGAVLPLWQVVNQYNAGECAGVTGNSGIWSPYINPTFKTEIPFHGVFNYLDLTYGFSGSTVSAYDAAANNLGYLVVRTMGAVGTMKVWWSAGDDFTLEQLTGLGMNIYPRYQIAYDTQVLTNGYLSKPIYVFNGTDVTTVAKTETDTVTKSGIVVSITSDGAAGSVDTPTDGVNVKSGNADWDYGFMYKYAVNDYLKLALGKNAIDHIKRSFIIYPINKCSFTNKTGVALYIYSTDVLGAEEHQTVPDGSMIDIYSHKAYLITENNRYVRYLDVSEVQGYRFGVRYVGSNESIYIKYLSAGTTVRQVGNNTTAYITDYYYASNFALSFTASADGQMDDNDSEIDDPLMSEYTRPCDGQMPLTRTWDFIKSTGGSIKSTLASPLEVYYSARDAVNQAGPTIDQINRVATKVDDTLSYLKGVALNIVDGVAKACSWITSTGVIFSAVLHFLQTIINPCWKSFCVAICGVVSSLGLFFGDFSKRLLDWFLSLRRSDPEPEDHRAGSQGADGQLETGSAFSDEEISSLVALVFGAVSGFLGYRGETPTAGIGKKLFNMSKNFWMTIYQSSRFLTSMVTLVKRCYNWCKHRMAFSSAASMMTEGNENIVEFVKEAQKMTDQRNLTALGTDPNLKYRFWCCVAAAYQHQARFSANPRPETNQILRICKNVIEVANKESIQAMACPVRYEPFVLAVEGESKIGKSFMLQHVMPEILGDKDVYGIRTYDSPIFVRTPGVEFWNGYRNQPCVLYDDYMATTSPEIATKQVVELYNLKSSAIMNLNMASLEEKSLRGNPFVVVLSTNNAFATINGIVTPEAFLRRKDALWRVRLIDLYSKIGIDSVPNDVKAKMGHLEFARYDDPAKKTSLSTEWIPFDQWQEKCKSEMAAYHQREQTNVRIRLERLKALLPESAVKMLHEVDPFKVFYAAHCGAADEPGLIQTGALPSELVDNALDILSQTMAPPAEEEPTPAPETEAVTPPADGQIEIPSFSDLKTRLSNLFYRTPSPSEIPYNYFRNDDILDDSPPTVECPVCRDENAAGHYICINKHIVCESCVRQMRQTGATRGLICPVCRSYHFEQLEWTPERFVPRLRAVLAARRLYYAGKRTMINMTKKTHDILEWYRLQCRQHPYLVWMSWAIAYTGLMLGVQYIDAVIHVKRDAPIMARHNRLNPRLPPMEPYVDHWGPIAFRNVREVRGQMENYEDASDNAFDFLTQPLHRDIRSHVLPVPEETLNVPECPHRLLLETDPQQLFYEHINGKPHWIVGVYASQEVRDCVCQFPDCAFRDYKTRFNLVNSWAYCHAEEVAFSRRAWNREEALWTLPREFLTPLVQRENDQRLNDMISQIENFGREKTFYDLVCEKWRGLSRVIKTLAVLVGGIAAFLGAYKLVKWMMPANAAPQVTAEIVNSGAYHSRRMVRNTKPIRRPPATGQGFDFDSDQSKAVIRQIERNTGFIESEYIDDKGKKQHRCYRFIGLFGRVACMPKHLGLHALYVKNKYNAVFSIRRYATAELILDMVIDNDKFLFGDNEHCYFSTPKQYPMFSDITNLIPTVEQHMQVATNYMHVECSSDRQSIVAVIGDLYGRIDVQRLKATEFNEAYDMFDVYESSYGKPGSCGAVYINTTNTPIFAMHVAGFNDSSSRRGFGVPLIREDIQDLKDGKLAVSTFVPAGYRPPAEAQMQLAGKIVPIASVGKDEISFMPTKTKIVPSLLQGKIDGVGVKTQPGILSAKDPRYMFDKSPLFWGCMKHTQPIKTMNDVRLNHGSEYLGEMLIQTAKPLRSITSVPYEMAVVGIPNLEYYDCIDMKTSAGWPWNLGVKKTKEQWIEIVHDSKTKRAIDCKIDDDLRRTMDQKTALRRRGIKPWTVFLDWLKDERRKANKLALADGTRIFSLSPLDFTIQLRQKFLDFSASFMRGRLALPHAIGMSADGPEWTQLVKKLLNKGPYIVTGDFKDFGPRLSAQALFKVFEMIVTWYRMYSVLSPDEIREYYVMFEEISQAYHIMHDFVYEALCGAPSGSAMTVVFNTLVNILYMQDAWLDIMAGTDRGNLDAFYEDVALFCYGDDMIMSVAEECVEKYNCVTLSKYFSALDVVFTDASKKGNIKYGSIEEATFLKRGFKRHPTRIGQWLAPLEELSIHECAQWIWKSPDEKMATYINAEQSLLLCYGHGPKYFNHWKNKINTALRENGMKGLSWTWEQLDHTFFGEAPVVGTFVRSSRIGTILDLADNKNVKVAAGSGKEKLLEERLRQKLAQVYKDEQEPDLEPETSMEVEDSEAVSPFNRYEEKTDAYERIKRAIGIYK